MRIIVRIVAVLPMARTVLLGHRGSFKYYGSDQRFKSSQGVVNRVLNNVNNTYAPVQLERAL